MHVTKHSVLAAVQAGVALILALWSAPTLADKRVALVIGNSHYQNVAQLPNPSADADAVAQMLKSAGFEYVDLETDKGYLDFKRSIRKFEDAANGADIAVVFFAGHGLEVGGSNYMIPVDARLADERDAEDEALDLKRIIEAAGGAKQLALIIVDACRNNPFVGMKSRSAKRTVDRGLARIDPPQGTDTLIAFAAKAGSTAEDGHGQHSPLTTALLDNLTVPGLDIRLAFGRVRDQVLKITDNRQEPFVYGSLGGNLISLVPQSSRPSQTSEPAVDHVKMKADYDLVEKIGTQKAWEIFLLQYATGFYADLAKEQLLKLKSAEHGENKIAKLEPPPQPSAAPPTPEDEREWEKLKESKDQQTLQNFIRRYPNSPRVLDAQRRLDILQQIAKEEDEKAVSAEWDKIKESSDQRALQAFVKRFPSSPLAQNARTLLDTLQQEEKARAEWEKIKDSADQTALQAFIARYPNSPLMPNAQSRLAIIQHLAKEHEERAQTEWDNIKESNDLAALKSFVARYPNSPLVAGAQSRLETLQQVAKEQEEKARSEWEKIKELRRSGRFAVIHRPVSEFGTHSESAKAPGNPATDR